MNAQEQCREFLQWLKAKQKEVSDDYWSSPPEAQRLYRLLLLKIQSEILTTEQLLNEYA